jgi:hypothetical protein
MKYYITKRGDTGFLSYSEEEVIDGFIYVYSPLGPGNMTGDGEYEIEDLQEITEEEYTKVSTLLVSWILDDEDIQDEYEKQLSIVMNKYGIS